MKASTGGELTTVVGAGTMTIDVATMVERGTGTGTVVTIRNEIAIGIVATTVGTKFAKTTVEGGPQDLTSLPSGNQADVPIHLLPDMIQRKKKASEYRKPWD